MHNTAVMKKGYSIENSGEIISETFQGNGITAFQHDICRGYDSRFSNADCIYSEIPWRKGYNAFIENSIAQNTTYKMYLRSIENLICKMNVPAFILCGADILRDLKPERTITTCFKFHNYSKGKFAIYNYTDELPTLANEYECMKFLAEKFNCILDFSCGYAEDIIWYAHKHNKNVILSDINPNCIRYINDKFIEGRI